MMLKPPPAVAVQHRGLAPRWLSYTRFPFVVWLLLHAGTLEAQRPEGAVFGTVLDPDGNRLLQIEVSLAREGDEEMDPYLQETDEDGRFRFRALAPGTYLLKIEHPSYARVAEQVPVGLAHPVTLRVLLREESEESIVTMSEPPDRPIAGDPSMVRLRGDEVGEIPLARDPWAALDQAPSVDSSGPQAAKGSVPEILHGAGANDVDHQLVIDGVPFSHPSTAPMPSIVGLEAVSAVTIRTGGSDPSLSSGGTHIDLVTKRGGDRLEGQIGTRLIQRDWNATPDPLPDASVQDLELSRLLDTSELDANLGRSLWPERLWGFFAVGLQQIEHQAVGGLVETTDLLHTSAKLTAQPTAAHSSVAAFFRSRRDTEERDSVAEGGVPDREPDTNRDGREPSFTWRLEHDYLLSSHSLLRALVSRSERDTKLTPLGGGNILLGEEGIGRGSFLDLERRRSSDFFRFEGSRQMQRTRRQNEFSYGFSSRNLFEASAEGFSSSGVVQLAGENFDTPFDLVRIVRPSDLRVSQQRLAIWLKDSLTLGNVRLDLGLRHERQRGVNEASRAAASPSVPHLLPAVELPHGAAGFEWEKLTPRLGLTWALGRQGNTLLRASYGVFASQMHADLVSLENPAAGGEVVLGFIDRNNDQLFEPSERISLLDHRRSNPFLTPQSGFSSNRIRRMLEPERTDELRFGVEQSLTPVTTLTLDMVRREQSNIFELRRLVVGAQGGRPRQALASDYIPLGRVEGQLPSGERFSVPVYDLRSDLVFTGGSQLVNGDRRQIYEGVTLGLTRRLQDGWMLRGYVAWNDWRWQLGPSFLQRDDPTDLAPVSDSLSGVSFSDNQGDVVGQRLDAGFGSGVLLNSRWSFNLQALVQVAPRKPWGFRMAPSLHGREGNPIPYSVTVVSPREVRQVQVTPASDSFRLQDIYSLDLRLDKDISLGPLRAEVSLDAFNILDGAYVLERNPQLNGPRANQILETLSPRTLRLGLRIHLD